MNSKTQKSYSFNQIQLYFSKLTYAHDKLLYSIPQE